jgi:hypothetical protein
MNAVRENQGKRCTFFVVIEETRKPERKSLVVMKQKKRHYVFGMKAWA